MKQNITFYLDLDLSLQKHYILALHASALSNTSISILIPNLCLALSHYFVPLSSHDCNLESSLQLSPVVRKNEKPKLMRLEIISSNLKGTIVNVAI